MIIFVHTHTHAHSHTHTHTHTHTLSLSLSLAHTHTQSLCLSLTHTCTHTHMHTNAHAHTCININTQMYIRCAHTARAVLEGGPINIVELLPFPHSKHWYYNCICVYVCVDMYISLYTSYIYICIIYMYTIHMLYTICIYYIIHCGIHLRKICDRCCPMGWLRCVGSIKLYVSFAEYNLFYRALLQKRPITLSILLTKATPYRWSHSPRLHLILWYFWPNGYVAVVSIQKTAITQPSPKGLVFFGYLFLVMILLCIHRMTCPIAYIESQRITNGAVIRGDMTHPRAWHG